MTKASVMRDVKDTYRDGAVIGSSVSFLSVAWSAHFKLTVYGRKGSTDDPYIFIYEWKGTRN